MPAVFPRRRSRRWIGFFVVLGVLSAIAIVVPLVYNLSIQLRPEQLAEARRRWQENGPADYDLQYLVETKHETEAEPESSEYLVKVRNGRVVLVVDTGEVVYLEPSLATVAGPGVLALSSQDASNYGVPALFDDIEAALRRDEAAGRKNYTQAQFDPSDGHPRHYIHSERGTKERVEWHVKFKRVGPRSRRHPD
ncbi:MAG TPA: DUF6174 domain-containing protein [Gemmataceae bacterium]|nr:DUF6174 domain-containing protein [Gemmataceae bacterium]